MLALAAEEPAVAGYLDELAASLPRGGLAGLRVAVDAGHGAAALYAGGLFERLGARVAVTGDEPDEWRDHLYFEAGFARAVDQDLAGEQDRLPGLIEQGLFAVQCPCGSVGGVLPEPRLFQLCHVVVEMTHRRRLQPLVQTPLLVVAEDPDLPGIGVRMGLCVSLGRPAGLSAVALPPVDQGGEGHQQEHQQGVAFSQR